MVRAIFKEDEDKISIRFGYSLYEIYQLLVYLGKNVVVIIVFPVIIIIVFYIGIFSITENLVFGLAFLNTGLSMVFGYAGGVKGMYTPILITFPHSIDLYYHNWLLVYDNNEYLLENFRDVELYSYYHHDSKQYEIEIKLQNERTEQTVLVLTHTSDTYKWAIATVHYISKQMDLGAQYSISIHYKEIFRDQKIAKKIFDDTEKRLLVSLLEGSFISKIIGILLVLVVFSFVILPPLYFIARIFLFYTKGIVAWIF